MPNSEHCKTLQTHFVEKFSTNDYKQNNTFKYSNYEM